MLESTKIELIEMGMALRDREKKDKVLLCESCMGEITGMTEKSAYSPNGTCSKCGAVGLVYAKGTYVVKPGGDVDGLE